MDNKKKFLDDDMTIVIIALLIGFIIGMFFPSRLSISARLYFHNLYLRLNPDAEKDSKTLIIEKVSQNSLKVPQKSIFEEPEKKENGFVLYIKKVFRKDKTKDKPQTLESYVLN